MPRVSLDGSAITDWSAFHDQCAERLGFPTFYGRNMNAWIDCLTYLRDGDGMSRFVLGPTEVLELEISGTDVFSKRASEILDALVECTAAVNQRHIAAGQLPAIHLVFV